MKNKQQFNNFDEELKYYFKKYEQMFGKKAFIQNPGGDPKKIIELIKKSLAENEDLLCDDSKSKQENILY